MKVINKPKGDATITMRTTSKKQASQVSKWWIEKDASKRAAGLIDTAAFLKENQQYRFRQTATYARLYGNMSLYTFIGANMSKLDQQTNTLPIDRPTMNVIQSATDTLVSRISQSRPAPVFLTDNGDYRERNLAKKLNNFILGEFYQAKAYEKAAVVLRDALVTGTGCMKIFEGRDNKVGLERVLLTELLTDPSEGIYSEPRQLYQLKLIDRDVLIDNFPKFKDIIEKAEKATPDNSADASKTVSDMVIVVEGWRLPSGKDAGDGRHTIACSAGECFDEEWTKDSFPFVFLHYSQRLLGFWAQGLAEQLMGTQMEINSLLYTISKAIKLVGVPRVFIEKGSKVSKASNNNDVGVIIEYSGTKPSYEVAPCVPEEMYAQLQRLIEYGYQQCGVSALQATSQKPAGLNSGEAIRSYDDISTDRFAALSRRYDDFFIALAYQVIDLAKEIAEREGSYSTIYPNKNGTKEIDLPKMSLIQDPFVIQCFNQSSLPRDPAGRYQKVAEMIQSGMVTIKEGRRLLDFPDLDQVEKLANASEERIYQMLDDIIDTGKYTPPDPFLDLALAKDITVQYINLYFAAKLEEAKKQKLITFFNQINDLITAATPPPMPPPDAAPGGANPPQAVPQPPPVSELLPNAPGAGQ
jgi:hypothetical protein